MLGLKGNPTSPDKPQKQEDSRFIVACYLLVGYSNWQHICGLHYFYAIGLNILVHPVVLSMGNSTFNKTLAAQKKCHVCSKWPFPFITFSTRVSKIGHLWVILNGPRESDGRILSWQKDGGEQLFIEGRGISLDFHVWVNSGASHCSYCLCQVTVDP